MPNVIILFALTISSTSLATSPEKEPAIEKRLKALDHEISVYRKNLAKTHGQKSDLEENLEKNEKKINALFNKIKPIEAGLSDTTKKIFVLKSKLNTLIELKKNQQNYIEKHIRAAHVIGNQEYLKLLLNQENPDNVSRMLAYYDYFNQARSKQINLYARKMSDFQRITKQLADADILLKSQLSSLNSERKKLEYVQEEKHTALKNLINQISSTGSTLSKLKQDRERLEGILNKLRESSDQLTHPQSTEPFAKMQGRLSLPVEGNVSRRFGNQRNQGKLKWQGLFIEAKEGTSVRAIYYGRVIFSDWLRGFGLLMIVSHGDGYMSLYGHNQALFKKTGELVYPGENIAVVGSSGGQTETGLYFEIRIDGKPNNPQAWCVTNKKELHTALQKES